MSILQTIGRMLLGGAIRRTLWRSPWALLAVAAIVGLLLMLSGNVRAQDQSCYSDWPGSTYPRPVCPTVDIAWAQAKRVAQILHTQPSPSVPTVTCELQGGIIAVCTFSGAGGNGNTMRQAATTCPEGTDFDPVSGTCGTGCSGKPPLVGMSVKGDGGAVCHGGCRYTVRMEGQVRLGAGTADARTFGVMDADGATCTAETQLEKYSPDRSVCRTAGTTSSGMLTQCVEPSGRECVTSGSGNRFCWEPSEYGKRIRQDGTLGADRVQEGQTPTPPSNQQNPQQVSTSTTTINNTTTTTTIYTGTGNSGGQSEHGEGGKGDGEEDGEGENGVSGGGSCAAPPSNCTGDAHTCKLIEQQWLARCDGKGEADSIANRAAQFEGEVNQLGDGDTHTQADVDGVMQKDPFEGLKTVEDGGMLMGNLDSSGFFGGGSCPTLESVTVGTVSIPLTLGPLCGLLANLSYLVLALAYFLSFRIVAGGSS